MFRTLRYITARHPLSRQHKLATLKRYVGWQLGSRLLPGPIAVPFVNNARMLVSPGMRGLTGNIYTGLHEFEDMAFVLHCLRPSDNFVDIGANMGAYTILASGVSGAKSVSFEPAPKTYIHLQDNIRLNDIGGLVTAKNMAVGDTEGVIKFTTALNTRNHVVIDKGDLDDMIEVPVKPLDDIAPHLEPAVIKIDVEGYETSVINGGGRILGNGSIMAVLMELNGQGARYGFDERALHQRMLDFDFKPFTYCPFDRQLPDFESRGATSGNTLYIKDIEKTRERVRSAPAFCVNGQKI